MMAAKDSDLKETSGSAETDIPGGPEDREDREETAAVAESPEASTATAQVDRGVTDTQAAAAADPESDSGAPAVDASVFTEQSQLAIPAEVYMIAGCKDNQTSADISDVSELRDGAAATSGTGGNTSGGATTHALLGLLEGRREGAADESVEPLTWVSLLESLRVKLKAFEQIPQISCSRQMDVANEHFSVFNPRREVGKSKAKALLIGINYLGQDFELQGCVNDVLAVEAFLLLQGYAGDDIRVLVDDGQHDAPTAARILEGFRWLVRGAADGDSLYFHFSGHGSFVPDASGDEVDGQDETILPLDYNEKGVFTDDLLLQELVLPLPQGCRLTCLVDACHSKSALDLPYVVNAAGDEAGVLSMVMNPNFRFGKLVAMGKAAVDSVEDALSGGMANLVNFAKGFGGVVPI